MSLPCSRIANLVPTEQELWALAQTEGFERREAIMQLAPDPTLPYCAAVYGTLGLNEIHVGTFKVQTDGNGKPWLRITVLTETEGPSLATCPLSMLDSVPPVDPTSGSVALAWRKRCRDFELMRHVSGSDSTRLGVLRNLSNDGRLVIAHIR